MSAEALERLLRGRRPPRNAVEYGARAWSRGEESSTGTSVCDIEVADRLAVRPNATGIIADDDNGPLGSISGQERSQLTLAAAFSVEQFRKEGATNLSVRLKDDTLEVYGIAVDAAEPPRR